MKLFSIVCWGAAFEMKKGQTDEHFKLLIAVAFPPTWVQHLGSTLERVWWMKWNVCELFLAFSHHSKYLTPQREPAAILLRRNAKALLHTMQSLPLSNFTWWSEHENSISTTLQQHDWVSALEGKTSTPCAWITYCCVSQIHTEAKHQKTLFIE